MTRNKKVDVHTAVALLKSGGSLAHIVISDLATSRVPAMDALLPAEHGCIVPDGNIVYDDEHVQYDPDFDDTTWGKPVSFKHLK